jgi:hypothetical protein
MMSVLRGHDTRVCPLECGPGTKARGEVCVAVDRVQPKSRKAEPEPRERKRRDTSRSPTEREERRAPAEKRAASDKPEQMHPLCTSRLQMPGGKWCCSYDPPRGATVIICR